jgi:hypothetical protein
MAERCMVLLLATVVLVVPPCRTGSEVCTGGGEGPPPRFKQTVPTLTTIQAGQTAYLTCEIFCVNNRSVQGPHRTTVQSSFKLNPKFQSSPVAIF